MFPWRASSLRVRGSAPYMLIDPTLGKTNRNLENRNYRRDLQSTRGLPWAAVKSIFDSLKQGGTCDEPDFCRHFSSSVAKDVMTGNCVEAGEPPVSNGSRFPMPENCSSRTVLNAFTRNPRSHANETVEGPVGEQAAQKDHGFGTEADGIARFWTAGAECLADRIRDQIRR